MAMLTQTYLNLSDLSCGFYKRECNILSTDTRLADISDLEFLTNYINEDTTTLFGEVDGALLLSTCYVSLCAKNIDSEVVAFLCLNGYPNIPSIPSWEWSHWLYNIYHIDRLTPRNTLWIHLAVSHVDFKVTFMKHMLTSVFADHLFLEYVVLVIPPGVSNTDWLNGLGTRIVPEGFSDTHKVQTLFLFVRQHFVTKYKIRRAVEEDNDDLVPLIHSYSERLQQHYGEFYIAELLTRHTDSGRKMIVAEYEDKAVALLCLNELVNYQLLSEAFDLVPFHGLKKPDDNDDITYLLSHQISATTSLREDADRSLVQLHGVGNADSIESFGPEEDYELTKVPSAQSIDQFSLVSVSSLHLDIDNDKESASGHSTSDSQCSAIILAFDEYEMHLFADKSALRIVSFDDLEHPSCRQTKPQHDISKANLFYGEPNAFTLELAAAQQHHEVESLQLLLEAAFECFPDRDYCVLSIPSTCPPCPLLQHFARVTPRAVSTYPQELYVLHRNVVLSSISVRIAIKTDIKRIEVLIEAISEKKLLLNDFVAAVNDNEDYQGFVMLSENQIIGMAISRREDDFEYLKSHYELLAWINEDHHKTGSHGVLEHLILSPIFQPHSRFFLREIHRLSDFSALYHYIYPADTPHFHKDQSLCGVISDLLSIRARVSPEYTQTDLEGCLPADVVHRNEAPFSLYLSTTRYCTLPRYEINRKIVVVGCSHTALAFLDSLFCGRGISYYCTFTNVTVVSPHGMPYQHSDNTVRDMMFPTTNNFNYRHMQLTSLRTYVNIVEAVMTGIDRKNKLLIVNDSNYLAYDFLFLMCGKQFQKPSPISTQKEKKQKQKQKEKQTNASFPDNVFLINTERDANNALMKLRDLIEECHRKDYKVIVYGYAIEAYCCLASLLEYGVPGENLVFVESFPIVEENRFYHKVSQFNDGEVDEAVQAAIISEEIKVYSSYYFVDWTYEKDLNQITAARFDSKHNKIFVDCLAMFMYNDKTVSSRTFFSINRAGLVFDGGLVVGSDCRTNDASIYAAGTLTKYSRRYYAEHMAHKYFNLEEIGKKLGEHMRRKLILFNDETEEAGPITCDRGNMLVPTYEKPISLHCRLPGNLYYLKVHKPGVQVPLEVAMNSDDYGLVLVTGDSRDLNKQGYFRIHLNQHGVVETITCLAKFEIDRLNIINLWGKHEKLLNNLQMRFEMILVTDLFEYFREPWTCAIYHDRFPQLEKKIKELVTAYTHVPGESLVEDIARMYKENEWTQLTAHQTEEVEEKFASSPYQTQLEQLVLDFLRDNDTFLPMYAHPSVIRALLRGFENSTLFQPQ